MQAERRGQHKDIIGRSAGDESEVKVSQTVGVWNQERFGARSRAVDRRVELFSASRTK